VNPVWFVIIAAIGVVILIVAGIFRFQWWAQGGIGLAVTTVVVGLFYIVSEPSSLGHNSFVIARLNESPLKELVLFLIMLLGMLARMLSLAIEQHQSAKAAGRRINPKLGLKLDRWDFIYPTLFAVPTFCGLLSQLPSQALSLAVLALAFQNGFFWQTILKKPSEN
jgi:hypothetical protein